MVTNFLEFLVCRNLKRSTRILRTMMELRQSKFGSKIPVKDIENAKHFLDATIKRVEVTSERNYGILSEFGHSNPNPDNANLLHYNAQLKCLQQSLDNSRRDYDILNEKVKALTEKMKGLEQEVMMFNELAKMQPETVQEQPPAKKRRGRPPKDKGVSVPLT